MQHITTKNRAACDTACPATAQSLTAVVSLLKACCGSSNAKHAVKLCAASTPNNYLARCACGDEPHASSRCHAKRDTHDQIQDEQLHVSKPPSSACIACSLAWPSMQTLHVFCSMPSHQHLMSTLVSTACILSCLIALLPQPPPGKHAAAAQCQAAAGHCSTPLSPS